MGEGAQNFVNITLNNNGIGLNNNIIIIGLNRAYIFTLEIAIILSQIKKEILYHWLTTYFLC